MEAMSRNRSADQGTARIGTIVRYALSHRLAMLAIAAALLAAGLWSSWGWLTALGLAPLVLALLPCAAMCALGLCMRHGDGAAHAPHDSESAPPDGAALAAPQGAQGQSGPAPKRRACH
ncbi:MAG TPA: hypothetical protein P5256_01805 [Beijerinckiaceae bacterium]|nr:hypothetical protein [Rhodoblastus sp.]HPG03241.1 hypothetical protein [Rhodoblastus sp.]HRY01830.1 hypothetical protein [Beijerinckiaceae bacterium]